MSETDKKDCEEVYETAPDKSDRPPFGLIVFVVLMLGFLVGFVGYVFGMKKIEDQHYIYCLNPPTIIAHNHKKCSQKFESKDSDCENFPAWYRVECK